MSFRVWTFGSTVWLLAGLAGCGRGPVEPRPLAVARAVEPPNEAVEPSLSALSVGPAEFVLGLDDDGFQVSAVLQGTSGGRRDVTREVRWSIEPPGVATVDAGGYARPVAAGTARIRGALGGETVEVALRVLSEAARAWDFAEDVVPVLTRAGCNASGCHGRPGGQNGFHLSLFGYDPRGDYLAITRAGGGRRVARVDPERSLVLAKATGRVPHGGGQRLVPGSPGARRLQSWLEAGAPETLGKTHGAIEALTVEPADARLDQPGPWQLRVVARHADGHRRDVTRLASFRSVDDSVLNVDPLGRATLLRRAEADLVVRYQSRVVSTRLTTIIDPSLDFDFATVPRNNFIDDELLKRLASLGVPPSPPATDAAFLRRASLDLTGLQPLPDEVRRFLADRAPDRRAKLVDRLLASREFVLFWKIKLGDLLQVTSARFGNGASYYHAWLEERIASNAPWDATVRTLLTALGNPMAHGGGPVNYALDGADAKTAAEQTARRFLGLRFQCAQCHDHPFDVWTQDDYFGLAAFFAKVQRPAAVGCGDPMPMRSVVALDPRGVVDHPRTGKPAVPRFPGGGVVKVADDQDPRRALADWMTSPDNPFFARAMANWVWAQFFGKGLADPADDLGRSNPPVHPELLDALARHFVEHRFDVKDLVRTVATSTAYGFSSGIVPGNEHDTRLFSHQMPRPLSAHQMADALAQATDVPNRFPNKPPHTRALEVYDPSTASTILDTFGRCARTVACASTSTPPLSLRQSLLLIGGDSIESKVSSLNGYLASLLELGPEPAEVVENLYLRTLCRPPTAEEQSRWSAELAQAGSRREAAEDLFWALLNSREFAFNH